MATYTARIAIQAPPIRVWEGLTRPDLVKQWQWNSTLHTDWHVGGDLYFQSEWQGHGYEMRGKVLEVVPHELIQYSLFLPDQSNLENYAIMTYTLNDQGGRTILTVEMNDPRSRPSEQRTFAENWGTVLAILKFVVEPR